MESDNRKEELLLNGFMQAIAKGVQIPPEWLPVQTEIITNVALPLFAKNHQIGQVMSQGMQQEDEGQEQGMQQNPGEEMAEQGQPEMQTA